MDDPPQQPGADAGTFDPSKYCDDGNDDPNDGCVFNQIAYCGDRYVHEGHEECDRGPRGFTDENCDFTTCKRKTYLPCPVHGEQCIPPTRRDCPDGPCPGWICVFNVCVPKVYYTEDCTVPSDACMLEPCSQLPGYLESTDLLAFCFIPCMDIAPCPSGLKCSGDMRKQGWGDDVGICVGESYETERVIEPRTSQAR